MATKTGFTEEDANDLKKILVTLFENDASSSRPAGSMSVDAVYWWKHNSMIGQYSSGKVHRSLKISPMDEWPYYDATIKPLSDLKPEILSF